MKKLDQYILKELFVPFLIGTFIVVLMFQVNIYIALAKTLNTDSIPFSAILQVILYKTPEFMRDTLPVGMALATSLAMSRLARESELTAIRTAGARILRVIAPMAIFGVVVAIANFYIVEKVVPRTSKTANRIAAQAAILGFGAQTFQANKVISLKQYTASFGTVQRKGDDLDIRDILLVERGGELGTVYLTSADSAIYHNGEWSFHNAYWRWIKGMDLIEAKPKSDFVLFDKLVIDDLFMPPTPDELSTDQIRAAIETGRKIKSDTKALEVQLYVKYSVPAACIVFAIVSPVFAIFFARTGGFVGVLVSFVVVLLYYNAYVISTLILGKAQFCPPWLAAWLPDILFSLAGLWAIRRLE